MKLLHTSDWHLGICLHRYSLIEDQRIMILQLADIIREQKVDVMMISGDIFDNAIASQEAISLFDEAMDLFCNTLKIKVMICAGNHDSSVRLQVNHSLLAHHGLYIKGKLDEKIEPIVIDDCEFYAIPFVHRKTIDFITDETSSSYEDAFKHLIDLLKKQFNPNKKHILLAHTFVMNAQICDSDRYVMVGGSDGISKDVFSGFDYVALGHLHRPQKLSDTIVYSGSPLAYSFSEVDQEKRVILIDTKNMKQKEIALKPLHKLSILKGTYEEVSEQMKQSNERDDYMKIELTNGTMNYECLQYFKEYYEHLLVITTPSFKDSESKTTLNTDEMEQLSQDDILKQYFMDYYHRELDKEEITWFHEAKELLESEEDK
ncbi:MAG: exonuclease SbcCD subunit D [Erysipelotrichaceae bacterium]